jgi:hypothetical protein
MQGARAGHDLLSHPPQFEKWFGIYSHLFKFLGSFGRNDLWSCLDVQITAVSRPVEANLLARVYITDLRIASTGRAVGLTRLIEIRLGQSDFRKSCLTFVDPSAIRSPAGCCASHNDHSDPTFAVMYFHGLTVLGISPATLQPLEPAIAIALSHLHEKIVHGPFDTLSSKRISGMQAYCI